MDETLPAARRHRVRTTCATETGGRRVARGVRRTRRRQPGEEAEARNSELEARIHSLENERQTLRKEIEEARERFTQSATFSKEREFLGLREIINKKEKDILDLRDALDAKDRADPRSQGQDARARPRRGAIWMRARSGSSATWSPPTNAWPS